MLGLAAGWIAGPIVTETAGDTSAVNLKFLISYAASSCRNFKFKTALES
jgi:hypothetical protein